MRRGDYNRSMKVIVAAFCVASAVSAFAQPRDLDSAKTSTFYNRLSDEVRAKKAMDKTHAALRTPKFRDALKRDITNLTTTSGAFITGNGTVFHALQLGLPRDAAKVDAKVVVFGEIVDASGKTVFDFEEPATLVESKGDLYVDRAVFLPVAKARGAFGVAVNGEVLAIGRAEFDDGAITKSAPGASRLLVSNNVFNMAVQQNPFEPFAFGGTKVVPKPDRSFRPSDEVWLFAELRNPALTDARLPKVSAELEIEGGDRKMRSAMKLDASPLKGVPDHYGVGTTINISKLTPGSYTIRFTLHDELAARDYEREETITVVR
jgi:hypothetical protein